MKKGLVNSEVIAEGVAEPAQLMVSNDDKNLVAVERDGFFQIFSGESYSEEGEFESDIPIVFGATLSDDGTQLVIVGEGGGELWSLRDQKKVGGFSAFDGHALHAAAFVTPGRILVAGDDGTARLIEPRKGRVFDSARAGERHPSIALSKAAKSFGMAQCFQGGSELVFGSTTMLKLSPHQHTINVNADNVSNVAFSPDGKYVAFADRELHIYNYPECTRLSSFNKAGQKVEPSSSPQVLREFWTGIAFTSDGMLVFSPPGSDTLFGLRPGESEPSWSGVGHEEEICTIATQNVGKSVFSVGFDTSLRMWTR